MNLIVATKSGVPIIGQVATLLGWLMNGIFKVLNMMGIGNIGLSIIIFTLIIYILLTPIQIKQQKMSKMTSIMNPELQAIQKKYKNKKDQDSMMKMQEETSMVYQKYGVSPMGSCLPLLIQMPILFALYQVIYRIPAYVGDVRAIFTNAVSSIINVNGYSDIIQKFVEDNSIRVASEIASENSVIDVLYQLSPSQWDAFANISDFSKFSDVIEAAGRKISDVQYFLGLNIADNPMAIITSNIKGGSILLVIGAVLVPVLAWLTQTLNYKLMPQAPQSDNQGADNMASTMKTMNTMMPLMSAFFCLTLPVGMGIYWIAGAVVRSIQMLVINRHMDKIDLDEMVKNNMEKAKIKDEKRRQKEGISSQQISAQAKKRVRNIDANPNSIHNRAKNASEVSYQNKKYKEGSLASKANMVQRYNDKNGKKK